MTKHAPTPALTEQEAAETEIAASGSIGSNSLLAAALLGSGATVIVGALGVVRTKALAVGLDADGLGLYGQILTLLTALSAASGLGLGLGTTRTVAESRATGDRDGLRATLEVSFALPLAIGVVLAAALAGASGLLAPWLLDDDRVLLILLAALALPLVAIQGPLVHALQGFRDVAGAQGANVFFGITLTVASIVGALTIGLDGAVLALAVGNLAYALALAWRLRSVMRRAGVQIAVRAGIRPRRLREPIVRTMLAIGFASLVVGVIATVGELVVRTIVLKTVSVDAAGIFQALQLISVQLIGVIAASMIFLSFTAVSEASAKGDLDRARRTIDDTLRLALLLVLPVLVALGLFREEFVPAFLSADFDAAVDLLPAQLVGDLLRTVAFALGAALIPLGATRAWAAISIGTTVAYVAAAAVLVPEHGLDGAVAAYVGWWLVAAVATVAVMMRRGWLSPSGLTVRTLACGLAVVAVAALPEPTWPQAVLGVVAFVGLLAALGTRRDERAAALARTRKMVGALMAGSKR